MKRPCVICGTPFEAPPSSKKITCSRPCSTEQKRRSHLDKHNQWSAESRERLSERGQTANLERGTPAARASPIAGPFETNQEAKIWYLRDLVTDRRYEVRNLNKFCRDHADLFWPDPPERAAAGLRQVQAWLMGTRKRQVSRWKHWTLERPAAYPDEEGDQ